MKRLNNVFDETVKPVTIVTGAVSAVGTALSFAFTETGPFVALGGVASTAIVAVLEGINRQLRILNRLAIPLASGTSDRLPEPLRSIAFHVELHARRGIALLIDPPNPYKNIGEFFHAAGTRLDRLGRGDEAVVVCADSSDSWKSAAVLRWLSKNYDATRRGVRFERILITQGQASAEHARAQVAGGISVVIVEASRVADILNDFEIPLDMGFAVVNRTDVYWHYGTGRQFRGAFVESPVLAAALLEVLSTLSRSGEQIVAAQA